jgi:hypothetical protein
MIREEHKRQSVVEPGYVLALRASALASRLAPCPRCRADRIAMDSDLERDIVAMLKEMMFASDLDTITSKQLRLALEKHFQMDLKKYRHVIDEQMITVMGQVGTRKRQGHLPLPTPLCGVAVHCPALPCVALRCPALPCVALPSPFAGSRAICRPPGHLFVPQTRACTRVGVQMEPSSKIFDYLYLGTEWNASNWEELEKNNCRYILNVTHEIPNSFPDTIKYYNVK